jgi:hypothetical protein
MTDVQKSAVEKIQALRKLTNETGFRTTRSQNELLASLSANDLAVVALALRKG